MEQQQISESQGNVSHPAGMPLKFSSGPFESFDPSQVVVEPVEPIDSTYGRYGGRCIALRNVLTRDECSHLIELMTSQGSMEPVKYRQDYRRNDRCVFDSHELAAMLWERVQPVAAQLSLILDSEDPTRQRLGSFEADCCPEELFVGYGCAGEWIPFGLNECLRMCRYAPGDFFRAHCDGRFRRSDDEMSLFTCMFYLDGDMDGGATRFLRPDAKLTDSNYLQPASEDEVLASLAPEAGLCLLFFQPGLLHEGEELRHGVKHILRTEVMSKRCAASKPVRTEQEEEAWRLATEAVQIGDTEPMRACDLYRRAFKLDPKLDRGPNRVF